MNPSFVNLVQWTLAHGYFLFFIAAFFEGPIITAAGGVAAALGYFNIYAIVGISVLGDLVGDTLWYLIGYFGGHPFVTRYGKYIGLTEARFLKIQSLIHKNTRKAMIIVKLSPIIPIPGLITIGIARIPFGKFAQTVFEIATPKSIAFALLGFFVGRAYVHLSGLITISHYLFFALVPIIVIVYIIYQRITASLSKKSGLV